MPLEGHARSSSSVATPPTSSAACPLSSGAGYGTGKICDACELSTTAKDIEYEVDTPDGRILRFHKPCFALWHQERATYLWPSL